MVTVSDRISLPFLAPSFAPPVFSVLLPILLKLVQLRLSFWLLPHLSEKFGIVYRGGERGNKQKRLHRRSQ